MDQYPRHCATCDCFPRHDRPEFSELSHDLAVLCDLQGVSVERVLQKNRQNQAISCQRQILAAAIKMLHPNASYPQLALLFNRANHTTMLHSVRVARQTPTLELVARYRQVVATA